MSNSSTIREQDTPENTNQKLRGLLSRLIVTYQPMPKSDTEKTNPLTIDQAISALEQLIAAKVEEAKADSYADCASKGGTGKEVRAYARTRELQYEANLTKEK